MALILVIICCGIIYHHKRNGLKQHTLLYNSFRGSGVSAQLKWVLCLQSQKDAIMVSAGLHLQLGILFQTQVAAGRSRFLVVPCDGRTEVFAFLQAAGCRLLSVSKGTRRSLLNGPLKT